MKVEVTVFKTDKNEEDLKNIVKTLKPTFDDLGSNNKNKASYKCEIRGHKIIFSKETQGCEIRILVEIRKGRILAGYLADMIAKALEKHGIKFTSEMTEKELNLPH